MSVRFRSSSCSATGSGGSCEEGWSHIEEECSPCILQKTPLLATNQHRVGSVHRCLPVLNPHAALPPLLSSRPHFQCSDQYVSSQCRRGLGLITIAVAQGQVSLEFFRVGNKVGLLVGRAVRCVETLHPRSGSSRRCSRGRYCQDYPSTGPQGPSPRP